MEMTVPSEAIVLGQVLRNHGDVRIELTQFVPVEQSLVPYFWAETTDEAAFEDAVRADDRVASLTKLDGGHERHLYFLEWATEINGLVAALTDHDLIVEAATGTPERWTFRLRGPDRGNLSSFQQALGESDIPITVTRVWTPTDHGADPYGLSAKQREALELAFTRGYFDVPAEVNLTDLAGDLDISRQSFSRRLTRGLHSLLDATLMTGTVAETASEGDGGASRRDQSEYRER